MDHGEDVSRVLFTRVQTLDGENALKIMGYLLLQDWTDQDLVRIACGPEAVLHSVVTRAKKELGLCNVSGLQIGQALTHDMQMRPLHPSAASVAPPFECRPPSNDSFLLAPNFRGFNVTHSASYPEVNEQWSPLQLPPYMYDRASAPTSPGFHEKLHSTTPTQFYSYKDESVIHVQPKWVSTLPSVIDVSSPHYSSLSSKACVFFSRGYCKHGNSCRFVHGHDSEKGNPGLALLEDPESTGSDDGFFSTISFERLEQELRELLKGRQAPVSIASLPQLYYERFGKSLQADGYLTESQRHGKAGFSLTKLLMKLKGIVTLIERPHGQHAVMLTEDALLFNEARGYRDVIRNMNASSRQIYLTFPAESTFTEEDVTIHFRAYGPVQDVRIPYQQKRMFGFVTFVYSDTVRTILTEGNPHYICGARVLVKPYKEKGRINDRRSQERDLFKQMSLNGHLPVRRYQREEYLTINVVEDDKVSALEQALGDVNLNEDSPNEPSSPEHKSDHSGADYHNDVAVPPKVDITADECLCADDGFSIQSSNFQYVLDLLDSETKDAGSAEANTKTINRSDPNFEDMQFINADIRDAVTNSMHMAKNYPANSQWIF
ncbi:hypothetical protein KP509_26G049200 [Ceratopteris richardii]|uniref:Uncharacterized protein n=2 Tax=Ceratopteris richardii TaxID=49495 RepID=A0A8T2RM27_CERRI|nr:hypothetical protein KP509_26G049200 [Ceratopteris richardii]